MKSSQVFYLLSLLFIGGVLGQQQVQSCAGNLVIDSPLICDSMTNHLRVYAEETFDDTSLPSFNEKRFRVEFTVKGETYSDTADLIPTEGVLIPNCDLLVDENVVLTFSFVLETNNGTLVVCGTDRNITNCGNGVLDMNETCDYGSDPGCNQSCTKTTSVLRVSKVTIAILVMVIILFLFLVVLLLFFIKRNKKSPKKDRKESCPPRKDDPKSKDTSESSDDTSEEPSDQENGKACPPKQESSDDIVESSSYQVGSDSQSFTME